MDLLKKLAIISLTPILISPLTKTQDHLIIDPSSSKNKFSLSLNCGLEQLGELVKSGTIFEDVWFIEGKTWHDISDTSSMCSARMDSDKYDSLLVHSISDTTYIVHQHPRIKSLKHSISKSASQLFSGSGESFVKKDKNEVSYAPPSHIDLFYYLEYQRKSQNMGRTHIAKVVDPYGVWTYSWKNTNLTDSEMATEAHKYIMIRENFERDQIKDEYNGVPQYKTHKEFNFEESYKNLVHDAKRIGINIDFEPFK